MSLIIKKFGGSSVANAERVFHVANIITDDYKKGNDVVVVVSAQGDTTDDLIEKAKEINPDGASKRELDMLLSAGEQMSIALLAMAIEKLGYPVISLLGVLVASPVFLFTALLIKLEDGGPVFYKQERATYAGRVFNVIKFRSMKQEDGLIHRSVTKNDDRITKVGKFIRKFRIDELPQLINVIKSDMSIVGPRPEMLENVEKYTKELPQFAYRQRAKAGLTGMAQIYGKYNTTPKDKLILDLAYINQYSVWLDVKLIFRTLLVLLTPDKSTEAFEDND